MAQAMSASGVSGGIGLGGTRQPSPRCARARACARASPPAAGRKALAVARHEGVDIHQLRDAGRARDRRCRSRPCRRSCDRSAPRRADPRTRARRDVSDVGLEIDGRESEVRALAERRYRSASRADVRPRAAAGAFSSTPSRPTRRRGQPGILPRLRSSWLERLVGRHGSLPPVLSLLVPLKRPVKLIAFIARKPQ